METAFVSIQEPHPKFSLSSPCRPAHFSCQSSSGGDNKCHETNVSTSCSAAHRQGEKLSALGQGKGDSLFSCLPFLFPSPLSPSPWRDWGWRSNPVTSQLSRQRNPFVHKSSAGGTVGAVVLRLCWTHHQVSASWISLGSCWKAHSLSLSSAASWGVEVGWGGLLFIFCTFLTFRVLRRINLSDFVDPLTFPLLPPELHL